VTVAPGDEASCEIRIRNAGQVVDQFSLEVLGDASGWALVEPPTVSLFPGAESVARIRFKPPRVSSVRSRAIPFAVRVRSREDSRASMVEEGVVEVGAFHDTFAELVPRTARGSLAARAQLALDNRGNTRINARLTASDPDRKLNFAITPPALVVEPGTAGFARLRLSPRDRFFTGPPKTLPFKVFAHQDGQPPLAADGVMLQVGLLPGWLVPVIAAVLGLAALLLILWLTVLQPSIKSAATAAVAPQASAAASAATRAVQAAAQVPASSGSKTGSTTGSTSNPFGGDPQDGRIKATQEQAGTIAPQGNLTINDIIFENPDGTSGVLSLSRLDPSTGSTTLLVENLDNFRDLDFHFVSPIVVLKGQQLILSCSPPKGQSCAGAMYYSGYFKQG
jgi:hypothetical protein